MKDKIFSAIIWIIVWWWVVFGYWYIQWTTDDETSTQTNNKTNTQSTQATRWWWETSAAEPSEMTDEQLTRIAERAWITLEELKAKIDSWEDISSLGWWRGQRWWQTTWTGSAQWERPQRENTGTGWVQEERPARWDRNGDDSQSVSWEKPDTSWEEKKADTKES